MQLHARSTPTVGGNVGVQYIGGFLPHSTSAVAAGPIRLDQYERIPRQTAGGKSPRDPACLSNAHPQRRGHGRGFLFQTDWRGRERVRNPSHADVVVIASRSLLRATSLCLARRNLTEAMVVRKTHTQTPGCYRDMLVYALVSGSGAKGLQFIGTTLLLELKRGSSFAEPTRRERDTQEKKARSFASKTEHCWLPYTLGKRKVD